jgi:DNA-directed RNA polymerase subunit RPC12/RpoP
MAITFPCQCGRQLTAPDTAAGLRARCPRCQAKVRVPAVPVERPKPTDTDSWRFLLTRAKAKRP